MSATARLALSRERLRQALSKATAAPERASTPTAPLLDSLNAIPGASIVLGLLKNWWAQHPLRVATSVLADAAKAVVRPIAQRHPLGLVLGAFVLGGLLAWKRPWRWILTPALFAGLLPQLASKAVAQVSQRSWLEVLSALLQPPPGPPKPAVPGAGDTPDKS